MKRLAERLAERDNHYGVMFIKNRHLVPTIIFMYIFSKTLYEILGKEKRFSVTLEYDAEADNAYITFFNRILSDEQNIERRDKE